jgi:hypothetical protein
MWQCRPNARIAEDHIGNQRRFERYRLANSAQVPVLCVGVFLDEVVPGRARLVLEDVPGEQQQSELLKQCLDVGCGQAGR